MTPAEYNRAFQKRTKAFALAVIKLTEELPKRTAAFVISKQLIRAATSVAANYRASCIARSDKERYAKLCIVIEEADESLYWLEVSKEAGLITVPLIDELMKEANELVCIFNASDITAKRRGNQNLKISKSQNQK